MNRRNSISNPNRRVLAAAAAAGRNGDTTVAHLTPGEVVVPQSLQTQRLMGLLAQEAANKGKDINRYVVGNPTGPRNPITLWEEFNDGGDGDGDADAGAPGHGDNGTGVGVGNNDSSDGDPSGNPGKGDNHTGIGVADSGMFSGMFDAPTGKSLGVVGTAIGLSTMGPLGLAISHGATAAKAIGDTFADAFGMDKTVDYSGPSEGTGAEIPGAQFDVTSILKKPHFVEMLKPKIPRPSSVKLNLWS